MVEIDQISVKLKKLKVCLSIVSQNTQTQNQRLK
jgi:hypothetical protein